MSEHEPQPDPEHSVAPKQPVPVKLTPRQKRKNTLAAKKKAEAPQKKAQQQAAKKALAEQQAQLPQARTKAQQQAARLAQIVNLHIAGYSLAEIGASIGATAEEVDRILAADAARYVRTQPALRAYVRNWVSERYTALLDTIWDEATDPNRASKLEAQDRAIRILERMTKLHGADAPAQTEVKVEAAPEAVEKLISSLAAQQGYGYDENVFDAVAEVVDAEIVHEAAVESHEATLVSGNAVEEPSEDPHDDELRDELREEQ